VLGALGRIALFALAIALVVAGTAAAAPQTPLGHDGRWITDSAGRVVILHGMNMVYKRGPKPGDPTGYAPDQAGFGEDDAAFLEANGFNTVRLGLIYAGVEPSPGVYDDAYLDRIAATEQTLAAHAIFSLLDFHQDLYNERFQGEGWPDWAVQDDGLPNMPQFGFPGNYLGMPALNRAFDNWWANGSNAASGMVGLQDRYAAAFTHVAQRFASANHTIGYDLLNEPWPGTIYPTCTGAAGCPVFDMTSLTDFSKRAIAGIRAADTQKLTWYEPLLTFDFGAMTSHGDTGDAQAGFSFHDYCLPAGLGFGTPPGPGCEVEEDLPFQNAETQSQNTGDALLLTEFGATDDLATIKRVIDFADQHMVGWQYWHYCGCDDPTSQDATNQAVVDDAALPPTGDNVRTEKLDLLSRPYPQVVAGTPQDYGFDEATSTFQLSFSTTGPGGQSFAPALGPGSPQTEIFVPPDDYPGGYAAQVSGGTIVSQPGAALLRIVACPGAQTVSITITLARQDRTDCNAPGSSQAGAGPAQTRPKKARSCKPKKKHRGAAPTRKRCKKKKRR
jgi:endoglycosylceramidase